MNKRLEHFTNYNYTYCLTVGIGYIRDSSLITLVYNNHYLVLSRKPLEKKRYSSLAVGIVWESSTIESSGFM